LHINCNNILFRIYLEIVDTYVH